MSFAAPEGGGGGGRAVVGWEEVLRYRRARQRAQIVTGRGRVNIVNL